MGRGEAAGRRCEPHGQSALIAAYREGLGLAAIAVTRGPGGMRNFALGQGGGGLAAAAVAEGRWWCRRAADAERLAAAAMRRLQRRESRNGAGPAVPEIASSVASRDASDALVLADEAITGAAKRLNLMLFTGDEIAAEALAAIARVDKEIERLRRSGELKSVNKSYRTYRLEASARGEKTLRYDDWIGKYRENLVRQLALALRDV